MGDFIHVVLVPGDTRAEDIRGLVDHLMWPYALDEYLLNTFGLFLERGEVIPCECRGRVVEAEAEALAMSRLSKSGPPPGPMQEESFWRAKRAAMEELVAKVPASAKCSYGCHGSGARTLAFTPRQPRFDRADILDVVPSDRLLINPASVQTPDGEWHSGAIQSAGWRQRVQTLYARHPDHLGAVVDCHFP